MSLACFSGQLVAQQRRAVVVVVYIDNIPDMKTLCALGSPGCSRPGSCQLPRLSHVTLNIFWDVHDAGPISLSQPSATLPDTTFNVWIEATTVGYRFPLRRRRTMRVSACLGCWVRGSPLLSTGIPLYFVHARHCNVRQCSQAHTTTPRQVEESLRRTAICFHQ